MCDSCRTIFVQRSDHLLHFELHERMMGIPVGMILYQKFASFIMPVFCYEPVFVSDSLAASSTR